MPKFIAEKKTKKQLYDFAIKNKIGNINSATNKTDLTKFIKLWQCKVGATSDITEYEKALQILEEKQEKTRKRVLIRGKSVLIDNSIIDIIQKLNKLGYKTSSSCSGIRAEHPKEFEKIYGGRLAYITFESKAIKDKKTFKNAVEKTGWKYELGKGSYRGSLFVELPHQYVKKAPDNAILKRFDELYAEISKLDRKVLDKKSKIGISLSQVEKDIIKVIAKFSRPRNWRYGYRQKYLFRDLYNLGYESEVFKKAINKLVDNNIIYIWWSRGYPYWKIRKEYYPLAERILTK